ncbi:MAG: amidohydrolase [Actinomycetota bacterium]|nr:amidohydrolase [Actinomycetota bacterium]
MSNRYEPPTVDAHVHVFKAVGERYPRTVHPMFPADMESRVEDLLHTMEKSGIEHAVLVPVSEHDDYLADCLREYPGRFAGIGVLAADLSNDAGDAKRRFSEVGIKGLRVHHLGHPEARKVEDLEAWPVLRLLLDLGGVVWLYVPARQLPLLEMILDRLDGLPVVLNHLGWPLPDEFEIDQLGRPSIKEQVPPPTLPIVERLASYDSVHVMFSGEYAFSDEPFPYSDITDVVRAIYRVYGARRMLWASDYPWIKQDPGYEPQLNLIDHYLPELPEEERAAIMGGTAARLFGFE